MNQPSLQLHIEKGPKEGNLLTCKPGSNIRIGRLVKGNTFTIKDVGISSNHLKFEFNEGDKKWVVFDLESSNGTFLNQVQIQGNDNGFMLNDGDVIKIGECTSIKVAFVANDDVNDNGLGRKNTKNGGKGKGLIGAEDVPVVENDDDLVGKKNTKMGGKVLVVGESNVRRLPPRRGKAVRGAEPEPEESDLVVEPEKVSNENQEGKESVVEEKKARGLGTRGKKKGTGSNVSGYVVESEKVDDCKEGGNGSVVEGKESRGVGTRGRKKGTSSNVAGDVVKFEQVEEKEAKEVGRRRGKKAGTSVSENVIDETEEVDNGGVIEKKEIKGVSTRGRKRATVCDVSDNVVKLEIVGNFKADDNVSQMEEKKAQGVKRRGRKKGGVSVSEGAIELQKVDDIENVGNACLVEKKQIIGIRTRGRKAGLIVSENVPPLEAELTRRIDLRKGKGLQNEDSEAVQFPTTSELLKVPTGIASVQEIHNNSSDNQPRSNDDSVPAIAESVGNKLDLQKMTLGEWFDYLEVSLPKHIHNAADEVIAKMRENASKFNNFLAEQQAM